MTTQEELVKRKLTLIELAEFLKNVSQAYKIHGVSRQHFYDIKKAYEKHGFEDLKEKTPRKPCIKNRVAPEIEETVLKMAYEYPVYEQLRVSNELRKTGILISSGGVRSIWLRHNLQTFKERLLALVERAAKEGIFYTEAQLSALETAKHISKPIDLCGAIFSIKKSFFFSAFFPYWLLAALYFFVSTFIQGFISLVIPVTKPYPN
jgi:transposase